MSLRIGDRVTINYSDYVSIPEIIVRIDTPAIDIEASVVDLKWNMVFVCFSDNQHAWIDCKKIRK